MENKRIIKSPISYIEFITKDNNTLKFELNNLENINKILISYFENIKNLICLDFHGVTDLYGENEIIPSKLPKCVISYIGGKPETIKSTIANIKPRILSNEILLGNFKCKAF